MAPSGELKNSVSFSVRRPVCVKHFTEELRAVTDPALFRKQFKTHFFSLVFDVSVCSVIEVIPRVRLLLERYVVETEFYKTRIFPLLFVTAKVSCSMIDRFCAMTSLLCITITIKVSTVLHYNCRKCICDKVLVSFGFELEDGLVWKESVAVTDGDVSHMLRRQMWTETMSDGDGWGWIQLAR